MRADTNSHASSGVLGIDFSYSIYQHIVSEVLFEHKKGHFLTFQHFLSLINIRLKQHKLIKILKNNNIIFFNRSVIHNVNFSDFYTGKSEITDSDTYPHVALCQFIIL